MKDKVATIIGIAIIIGFGVLVFYMLIRADHNEPAWSHAVYIFGSVEAIAFTAAGYLFGKEVHRERAESAEKSAARNREKAESAEGKRTEAEKRETEARTKGEALAAAIVSRAGAGSIDLETPFDVKSPLIDLEDARGIREEGDPELGYLRLNTPPRPTERQVGEMPGDIPPRGARNDLHDLAAFASKLFPDAG